MLPKDAYGMAYKADSYQTTPKSCLLWSDCFMRVWSRSILFAQTCLSENLGCLRYNMSRDMTKPTVSECPVKTQISLGIHPVWSVFAVRMKKAWVLSYPFSTQLSLCSDWVDAQTDLSLCWAHTHFVGFVMSWLIYRIFCPNLVVLKFLWNKVLWHFQIIWINLYTLPCTNFSIFLCILPLLLPNILP